MKKDAAFAELCAALPGLTPEQLEQVRLRAAFLVGGAATVSASGDRDWLLRGIEDELRRRGLFGSGRIPAEKLRADWNEASARIRSDLLRALGEDGERKTGALGMLAARVLASWLERQPRHPDRTDSPVSPKTMLRSVEQIFVALDEAFPGYVGAGLLRCCLAPELVGGVR